MFSGLVGVISNDMAIDLGTANTLVYVPGRGIVLEEPSVVAFGNEQGTQKVIAVGQEAKAMLGRTPDSVECVQPMRDGVIADFVAAEEMIKYFIRRVHNRKTLISPRIMICVPADATPVERRAVQEAALSAGARKIYLIQEPVAAAIGVGLPVSAPRGAMVVDIGGGTTDIAVMSLGGIIYSRSIRTAGNAFDDAIINYIRHTHNLLIGQTSAERIKIEAGTAIARANGKVIEIHIKGRDLKKGRPNQITLGPPDIAEALARPLARVADGIKIALEQIEPELAADIYEDGIYLTGGGALLDKISTRLSRDTGVKYITPEDPLRCVAIGTGRALEQLEDIKDLLAHVQ
ncbi:MAG TPA: rod shape-determining protein [Rhizobiales bacterium]|nr:Rod shape-determining protein MreB [bacterium BMS3Bbin10]HDO52256.1 rod shape-determining protein [Hyphomicrobiales bacterium]